MYIFTKLSKVKGIKHAFSTVDEGDQSFNFLTEPAVVSNRKRFLGKLGLGLNDCVAMRVTHGNKVLVVGKKHLSKGMVHSDNALVCDGLLTSDRGVFLFLKIADCAPVVLYDVKNKTLGLIHVGWKNVENKTIVDTIETCKLSFSSSCKDLRVYIGPCIRKDSYIVQAPKQVKNPVWKNYIQNNGRGFFKIDFLGMLKKQLLDSGVSEINIFDCAIDTARDSRFYSYFLYNKLTLGPQGRFACVVGMV